LTYETVWDLEELPPRLAVVGGWAHWLRVGLGILPVGFIGDAGRSRRADHASRRARGRRCDCTTSGPRRRRSPDQRGFAESGKTATGVRLVLGDGREVEADAVLVPVKRRPQVEGLVLEQAKVNHGPGGIQVNKKLRTSQPNIFAAGDCTGGYQFTDYAGYQGSMVVRNAFLLFRKKSVLDRVPWATFTDPEVAHVGLTESKARGRYEDKVEAAIWPMGQTDRWVAEGDTAGFLKMVHLSNGKLLGVTIVAPRAG